MTNNGYASRETFLAPAQRRFQDVSLPCKGVTVRIRSLLESEKEAYEAAVLTAKGELNRSKLVDARRRLIVLCLCDGNGDQLLSDADLDSMKQLDGADLAVLQESCQAMCGLTKGDIETLVKNSGSVHADS